MPAAAIRACIHDPLQKDNVIPAMEIFYEEIQAIAEHSDIIVESNKFVVHPIFQRKSLKLKYDLFSFIFNLSIKAGAKCVVTAVREEHAKFYKKMNFYSISGLKRYPGLNFDTVLLASDMSSANELPAKIQQRFSIQPTAA